MGPSLRDAIPTLPVTPEARTFLLRIEGDRAWTRTAELQARSLGLKNRGALRDRLLSLNLPQWGFLKRWFRLYTLVLAAEQGRSFAASALAEGHNPSSVYHSLEGALKLRPSEILLRGGTALLLSEFVAELARIRGDPRTADIEDSSASG